MEILNDCFPTDGHELFPFHFGGEGTQFFDHFLSISCGESGENGYISLDFSPSRLECLFKFKLLTHTLYGMIVSTLFLLSEINDFLFKSIYTEKRPKMIYFPHWVITTVECGNGQCLTPPV